MFAYVPAPIIGTSPILPHFLFVVPPVEVPDAIFPILSIATQPTVPYFESFIRLSSNEIISSFFAFLTDFKRLSVIKYELGTVSNPILIANSSAPSEESRTCCESSITDIAAMIGFLIYFEPAIAPALRFSPSIKEASKLAVSSLVKAAPIPALNNGESSIIFIVSLTANWLDPPDFNISYPVITASSNLPK